MVVQRLVVVMWANGLRKGGRYYLSLVSMLIVCGLFGDVARYSGVKWLWIRSVGRG